MLANCVDSLVIVLNSRLEEVLGDDITQKQAFPAADDVLSKAVSGIAEIINVPGMINVDFEDVRTVMRQTGTAMMGSAEHSGEDRAIKAAEEAISCPLLDGSNLHAARGLLVNIAASEETLKLRETKLVMNVICEQTSDDAIIKFGAVFDDSLGDAMRVTVVATGLSRPLEVRRQRGQSPMSRRRASAMGRVVAHGPRRQLEGDAATVDPAPERLPGRCPGGGGPVPARGPAPRQPASNSGEDGNRVRTSHGASPGNH